VIKLLAKTKAGAFSAPSDHSSQAENALGGSKHFFFEKKKQKTFMLRHRHAGA
jgi:hypothetical protein